MTNVSKEKGIFLPHEVEEMRDELNRDTPLDETPAEREDRAAMIIQKRDYGRAAPAD